MRLTIVGSGDAFGSGGRFNTCFHVATRGRAILIDCGASTMVALRARAIEPNSIDAIILTHLHGDHFGGIPFVLLDAQYMSHRQCPLTIAGPPGTRERIAAMLEAAFPSSPKTKWRFPWSVTEIAAGDPVDILGLTVTSADVIHYSGAPSTALRLTDGQTTLAYSGDTEWTDALIRVAAGADLLVVECYGYDRVITGHLSWATLRPRLPALAARKIMLTHMSAAMLAHTDEAIAAGFLVASDGAVVEV
jgi:ribonuclease BN (tRNA processing enzyme)